MNLAFHISDNGSEIESSMIISFRFKISTSLIISYKSKCRLTFHANAKIYFMHAFLVRRKTETVIHFYWENYIQLLDETEQNIVIYQWRADQLFASAFGIGK